MPTKAEIINQSPTLSELDKPIEIYKSGEILELDKGGIIIKTALGNIQYGIPPETVKDSISIGVQVPEYYIIPREKFDWNDGISLMEFEFPVYFNFFLRNRNKTKLICDKETMERIEIIFQETLLGPKDFSSFKDEFIEGDDVPDIANELAHFSKNPFNTSETLSPKLFIEFIIWDKKNTVSVRKFVPSLEREVEVKITKLADSYDVYQDDNFLLNFEEGVTLKRDNFHIYKALSSEFGSSFDPPVFGITMLGSSHGFDACGSTSGYILWINKKGIMIDPPPYSSRALREQGIPPNLIEKIIISHCHADHDAGAFHKIIEASPIEFLSTKTILGSFLRKYSAISGMTVKELTKLFQYRTFRINTPIYICGARFIFNYGFHSIPSLSFEVNYKDKWFYFSGDTFFVPSKLKQLHEEGLFNEKRFKFLAEKDFKKYDLILHEAGIPPIHTPMSELAKLDDDIKKKIYLYHVAEKDVLPEFNLKAVKTGLNNSIIIIDNIEDNQNPIMDNLDLLCSMEIITWVPFNRILEIIDCFKVQKYAAETLIIEENTKGDIFYIVKKGIVQIYSETPDNSFSKLIYRGDYFGESAIIGDGSRLANVRAITDTVLLEIRNHDFKWIFDYQNQQGSKVGLSPLTLMKNLSEMRKAKSAEFINANKTISKMTENQKCLLNMFIKEIAVKKDEQIWRKGDNPNFCLIIKSGKYQMKAPAHMVPKNFSLKAGTLVGDFPWLLQKEECLSSVTCLEEGVIYKITKKHLDEFLKQYPGFYIVIKNKYVIY